MARTINFNVSHPDGSPWVGVRVPFQLNEDDYTAIAQYPSYQLLAVATDSDGDGSIDLWQNELGLETPASYYICTLPSGEVFRFTVPDGSSDLELGTRRAAY